MNGFYDIVNSKDVLIAAHRGNSLNTPENTIIAFEKAVEAGVDMIELDVQFTKDNKIVVFHNDDLVINNNAVKLLDLNYDDIKNYKIYYNLENGQQAYMAIPLLKDVLNIFKGKIYFIVEIKNFFNENSVKILPELCDFIINNNLQNQLTITSFDIKTISFIKKYNSSLLTAAIYIPNSNILPSEYKYKTNCDAFVCDIEELSNEFVIDAKSNNMFIGVYGVNDKILLDKALNNNVKFIGTDVPNEIKCLLK